MTESRPRVLYILGQYPQLSETYIETELRAVADEFAVKIISMTEVGGANNSYKNHLPFEVISDFEGILQAARSFKPDVLHGHWLVHLETLAAIAEKLDLPFTMRAHSFDTLPGIDQRPGVKQWFSRCQGVLSSIGQQDRLLGVLAFPFSRRFLESCGLPADKVIDCFPCLDYQRFFDPSENGRAVMNTGACIPKKRMVDFLALAKQVPELEFDTYPVSYEVENFTQLNGQMGYPVRLSKPVEPEAMGAVYKAHRWLVYTACPIYNSVGWPVSIAEAQASGTAVIMADIRPDLEQYIGGAGFLYRSIEQVKKLIRQPVPDEIRQLGFEQARRSDITQHRHLLTNLWKSAG